MFYRNIIRIHPACSIDSHGCEQSGGLLFDFVLAQLNHEQVDYLIKSLTFSLRTTPNTVAPLTKTAWDQKCLTPWYNSQIWTLMQITHKLEQKQCLSVSFNLDAIQMQSINLQRHLIIHHPLKKIRKPQGSLQHGGQAGRKLELSQAFLYPN